MMDSNSSSFLDISDVFLGADNDRIEDLIMLVKSETADVKKLEYAKDAVKFLQTVEQQERQFLIIQELISVMKGCLLNILEENIQKSTPNLQENDMNELKKNYQNCIIIFELLANMMDILQKNPVEFNQAEDFSKTSLMMLVTAFQHCKTVKKNLQNCVNTLKQVLDFFRNIQSAHTKLLNFLQTGIVYDNIPNCEVSSFLHVLDLLRDINDVLTGMNIQSLVYGWKCYLTLIQENSTTVKTTKYSLEVVLKSLYSEINFYIDTTLTLDKEDEKKLLPNIKFTVILLKVAIKLQEVFQEYISSNALQEMLFILISFYKFYPTLLLSKGYNEEIVSFISQNVFPCQKLFCEKLQKHHNFYEVLTDDSVINHVSQSNHIFFLFFATEILPQIVRTNNKETLLKFRFPIFLDTIFNCVQNSFSELFTDFKMNPTGHTLFEDLSVVCAAACLYFSSLDQNVHCVLFRNILQEDPWCALLAVEIWCLALKFTNSRVCYETLCKVLAKTEIVSALHFFKRPEHLHLKLLISRLFGMLEEEHKVSLIQKYSQGKNLFFWKMVTLKTLPISQKQLVGNFLSEFIELAENFGDGRMRLDCFKKLCDLMDVLASFDGSEVSLKTKKYVDCLMRLWELDVRNTGLLTSDIFKIFVGKLAKCTTKMVTYLTSKQLLMVLTQIKTLIHIQPITLEATKLLQQISQTTSVTIHPKSELSSMISEIFSILLKDLNPLIRLLSLDAFVVFITHREDFAVEDVFAGRSDLQKMVADHVEKNAENNSENHHLKCLGGITYNHVCVNWGGIDVTTSGLRTKRFKSSEREIGLHLGQIKEHVGCLRRVCCREDLSEENLKEISEVIEQLLLLRKGNL